MRIFSECGTPKLTVVSMARNEGAAAHDKMRHFCALFDRVILIDHLSVDETAQIAKGYNGIAGTEVIVLRGEDSGYYQSEYMSAVANALLTEGASDWIFFIDFDEFLPFHDATSFRQALINLASYDIIHMHWHNLALTRFDIDTLQGAEAVVGPIVSDYVKIAINARRVKAGQITVCQGNHAVVLPGENTPYVGKRVFELFHVPITSIDALRSKVAQGSRALQETIGGASSRGGGHWSDIFDQIDQLATDRDLVREVALNYGCSIDEILKSVAMGQLTASTRPITLKFAQTDQASSPAAMGVLDTFTLATIDALLASRFTPARKGGCINAFFRKFILFPF